MSSPAWVDYGTEGWHPYAFQTEVALIEWILGGNAGSGPILVTRPVQVRLTLAEGASDDGL